MINTEPGGAGTMGDDSKCHFSVDLHPPSTNGRCQKLQFENIEYNY